MTGGADLLDGAAAAEAGGGAVSGDRAASAGAVLSGFCATEEARLAPTGEGMSSGATSPLVSIGAVPFGSSPPSSAMTATPAGTELGSFAVILVSFKGATAGSSAMCTGSTVASTCSTSVSAVDSVAAVLVALALTLVAVAVDASCRSKRSV